MDKDKVVSVSVDSVFGFLRSAFEFVTSLFRPVSLFIREVAAQSWLGAALVFAIFFTLLLIRLGAKSSKGIAVYSASLRYVGKWGLIACAAVLALLGIEFAVMPLVAVVVTAVANTLTGGEPGIAQFSGFLLSPSAARSAFLGDVAAFYREGHTAFPLGFRAVVLVAVAFGSMFMVGKAAGAITSPPPPAAP